MVANFNNNFEKSSLLAVGTVVGETIAGFTLAEVLLTLLIIGIVGSIVIPGLIQDTQNAELHTAWKKAYSDFSQASKRLAIDNGGDLTNVFSNSNDVRDELSVYLSSVKKCDSNTSLGPDGCWNAQIYNLSGTAFTYWTQIYKFSRMELNNGMLIAFILTSSECTYYRPAKHNGCAMVFVDINGFKNPNTIGKDIYFGYITKDGSFEAFGKSGDEWSTRVDSGFGCDSKSSGFTCAALYLTQ